MPSGLKEKPITKSKLQRTLCMSLSTNLHLIILCFIKKIRFTSYQKNSENIVDVPSSFHRAWVFLKMSVFYRNKMQITDVFKSVIDCD